MKTLRYFFNCLFSVLYLSASSQNTPNNSSVPGGPYTGKETAPKNFDASPNTAPTYYNVDRVFVPLVPMSSVPTYDALSSSIPIVVSSTYNDGWGRPMINVQYDRYRNLVTPIDTRASHTNVKYLPYPKPLPRAKFVLNPFQKTKEFYAARFPVEDTCVYGKTKSYASAGVPTVKNYAPGAAFIGKLRGDSTTTHIYGSYRANSAAPVMKLTYNGTNVCNSGNYTFGELIVTRHDKEHNQQTLLYKDRSDRVICKSVFDGGYWQHTYYMYNDIGKLIFIVPPKAAADIEDNGCATIDLKKLCFSYEYDKSGNPIKTQTPGKTGQDYAVYNYYERPVLSQTPLMRSKNQWFFRLYDQLGREVMTGIYTGTDALSYWQALARGETSAVSRPMTATQTLDYWLTNHLENNAYPDTLYNCVIHSYNYYDTYADTPANYVGFNDSYASHYLSGSEMVIPKPLPEAYGKLVASKVRILDEGGSNNFVNKPWITTVYFYDEKGQLIQTQTKNPWNISTWDVTTMQYNFTGKQVLNIAYHKSWSGSSKPETFMLTKYKYDPVNGRLTNVEQKCDTNVWVPVAEYTYNEIGLVSQLQQGSVEVQQYDYNIRNQMTFINRLELRGDTISMPNMTYASQLCYETGFTSPRYDGKLTGYRWRSKSTTQRAYGYQYDNAGRLTRATYRDSNYVTSTPTWHANTHNYTVDDIEYDINGNIQAMTQYGPKTAGGYGAIDMLDYSYDQGNQLSKVEDPGWASPINDFDNGSSANNPDYTYDADGNQTSDANKQISLITYNHQDQPLLVVKGTDSIRNIYAANGTLIQKTIREGGVITNHRYWGPLVYRNDSLNHILHQEGRARWLPDSGLYKYDYFVKDHQGNVRNVVCGDYSLGGTVYTATWEVAYANVEEGLFTQVGPVRDNKPLSTPQDLMSGHLNGFDPSKRIGASILLHGMAGDQIDLQAWGYYESEDTAQYNTYAPANDMASALLSTMMTATGVGGGESGITTSTVSSLLNTNNYMLYDALKSSVTDPAFPRAYLNLLVFDEDMQLLPDECHVEQLKVAPNTWAQLRIPTTYTMRRTGYMLLYVSNESATDVFFDNKTITHWKGRLIQENQHYYPHGLVIQGTPQTPSLKSNYLFEGNTLQEELGWQMSDFNFREYDQQIGRFTSIDPLATSGGQESWSPYSFVGNDPANFTDQLGLGWHVDRNGGVWWDYGDAATGTRVAVFMGYLFQMETNARVFEQQRIENEMMQRPGGGSGGVPPEKPSKHNAPRGYQEPKKSQKETDAEMKKQKRESTNRDKYFNQRNSFTDYMNKMVGRTVTMQVNTDYVDIKSDRNDALKVSLFEQQITGLQSLLTVNYNYNSEGLAGIDVSFLGTYSWGVDMQNVGVTSGTSIGPLNFTGGISVESGISGSASMSTNSGRSATGYEFSFKPGGHTQSIFMFGLYPTKPQPSFFGKPAIKR